MNTINKIAEYIKKFAWEHPTKAIFISGVMVGFILGLLF